MTLVAATYRYCAYGITLLSDVPLALPERSPNGLGQVSCVRASSPLVQARRDAGCEEHAGSWFQHAFLPDGSIYARWRGVGDFLVSPDGREICWCRDEGSSEESAEVYLLGQALSFALVQQGLEPLHAATVVVGNDALAFLGGSGFGKSTLAAFLLSRGARLLTDDLLLLDTEREAVLAYPGPPRIKLFAKTADRMLGGAVTRPRMNPDTAKQIAPLDRSRVCAEPVRLAAIYDLAPPRESCRHDTVTIQPLSTRNAFPVLLRSAFNRRTSGGVRTARQFAFASSIAERVPVSTLTYPRTLDVLPDVRRALLAGLTHGD